MSTTQLLSSQQSWFTRKKNIKISICYLSKLKITKIFWLKYQIIHRTEFDFLALATFNIDLWIRGGNRIISIEWTFRFHSDNASVFTLILGSWYSKGTRSSKSHVSSMVWVKFFLLAASQPYTVCYLLLKYYVCVMRNYNLWFL